MIQNPVDKTVIFFQGHNTSNWVSTDCGGLVEPIDLDRKVNEVVFNPVERNWIMISSMKACNYYFEKCHLNNKDIYYSINLGKSWTSLASNVVQFDW